MLCEGWRAEGKAKINEGETGGSNEVKAGPAAPHTDDVTAEMWCVKIKGVQWKLWVCQYRSKALWGAGDNPLLRLCTKEERLWIVVTSVQRNILVQSAWKGVQKDFYIAWQDWQEGFIECPDDSRRESVPELKQLMSWDGSTGQGGPDLCKQQMIKLRYLSWSKFTPFVSSYIHISL